MDWLNLVIENGRYDEDDNRCGGGGVNKLNIVADDGEQYNVDVVVVDGLIISDDNDDNGDDDNGYKLNRWLFRL